MNYYCPNCGTELSKNDKFCINCGAKQIGIGISFNSQKKWSTKLILKIIAVIIISGIAGFIGTLIFDIYAEIDFSILRTLIGFIMGSIAGMLIVGLATEKDAKKSMFSSGGFKRSLGYTIGGAITFWCLFGFVWLILVAVSIFEAGDFGNIFKLPWFLIPVLGGLPIGIAPLLIHSKYEKIGAILFFSSILAMILGFIGVFFADMEIIEMSKIEGLIIGVLIGGAFTSIGIALFTSSLKELRTMGGCILGGVILGTVGFMYSFQRYVGSQYTLSSYIVKPSEIFNIAYIGIALGIILGGIVGYLNFDFVSLRNKKPLAFIAISPVITTPIGFLFGWFYRIITFYPKGLITGLNIFELGYITPYGVFLLIIIWAIIGFIAGIATIGLKIILEQKG